MKIAVVGSRDITAINLDGYLLNCDEIVSGGAKGVDLCAAEYADKHNIKLTVFLPDYKRYGRAAPIKRNEKIVDYADKILVFWNGISKGSNFVIKYAEKIKKECTVIICK